MYPATGYLCLAWQLFADMNRLHIENCDVEFEDVKFLRATTLTKQNEIKLIVNIHKGTGRFEIIEGINAIVTGFIRSPTTSLTPQDSMICEESPLLPSRDFYKELRLRGYQYKNLFRSIVNARSNGCGGKIKWNSNWVAFLDCLLQVQIIGKDTRMLMLPTSLRKVIIKPREHLDFILSLPGEEKVLEVKSSTNLNLLRCGGIEIRGLNASLVGRRRPPSVPVLETYEFVPHFVPPSLSRINLARFCVQLALENLQIQKFSIVEVDAYDGKEPLSSFFAQALGDLPLVTGDLNYLTSRPVKVEAVNVHDCVLTTFNNAHFIIDAEVVSNLSKLEILFGQLCEGGFILSRETNVPTKIDPQNLSQGCQIVAIIPLNDEFIVILQYFKVKPKVPSTVIAVTSENFDWLEKLKEAIKQGPVIAYSQNDPLSGIIGLVNCIRKEPNGLNLRCVFIDDARVPSFDTKNQFFKTQLELGLAINVFKNGQWGSYRHFILQQEKIIGPRIDHCFANSLTRGDLSSMTWLDGPYNQRKPGKSTVKVQYASLNFRDVMLATGKITVAAYGSGRLKQTCVLGLEYAGCNENGQRVMGMVLSGGLASFVEADEKFLWECPDDWTLEEAATVPVVYATVYCAYFNAAQIKKGKSILIHAGTGGVGLAAIRVAFAYGLEVYTTVSNEEKKKFLLNEFPELKENNIGNSRDISFEDLVMNSTDGKGVDYVLNSLADEKLQASVRCLGKGGKFLEIGKFDMEKDSNIGLGHFLKEISFHSVLADNLFDAPLDEKEVAILVIFFSKIYFFLSSQILHQRIENDIKRGIIKPLKTNVFPADEIEQAFRFLASGKHIGKVVLKIRENFQDKATVPISVLPRVYCNPDLTYIIPGGLGGFGLELADWLVLRGCRKLVLSSSKGITKQYQAYRIK